MYVFVRMTYHIPVAALAVGLLQLLVRLTVGPIQNLVDDRGLLDCSRR